MSREASAPNPTENPFPNLIFNIILPVLTLNQLSKRLGEDGPLYALIIALLMPMSYGTYDYIKRKKSNYISLIGLIHVAVTGGLALLALDGRWFALKEAFFPLLIGGAVFVSVKARKPFMKTLFWNEHIFHVKAIEEKLGREKTNSELVRVFQNATKLFGLSFLISSALNFLLASQIFTPIDQTLSLAERQLVLNQQIAQMTWKGYLVIALPMMFFMGGILWYLIRELKRISGMTFDEVLAPDHSSPSS